jgi:hypothetical protein
MGTSNDEGHLAARASLAHHSDSESRPGRCGGDPAVSRSVPFVQVNSFTVAVPVLFRSAGSRLHGDHSGSTSDSIGMAPSGGMPACHGGHDDCRCATRAPPGRAVAASGASHSELSGHCGPQLVREVAFELMSGGGPYSQHRTAEDADRSQCDHGLATCARALTRGSAARVRWGYVSPAWWRRPQIATSLTDYRLLKCRFGVVQTRLGVESESGWGCSLPHDVGIHGDQRLSGR